APVKQPVTVGIQQGVRNAVGWRDFHHRDLAVLPVLLDGVAVVVLPDRDRGGIRWVIGRPDLFRQRRRGWRRLVGVSLGGRGVLRECGREGEQGQKRERERAHGRDLRGGGPAYSPRQSFRSISAPLPAR